MVVVPEANIGVVAVIEDDPAVPAVESLVIEAMA
jgi:hypothetical protein